MNSSEDISPAAIWKLSWGRGVSPKPLKTELHHGWPRSLQKHWSDGAGTLSVARPDGTTQVIRPGNFGAITNAHHMMRGGPWASTFEPIFNQPDSEMGDLIAWIYSLEANEAPTSGPTINRISAQEMPEARQRQLARAVSSLVARSPRTRNVIRLTTEHYRGRMGLKTPEVDMTIIALNQRGLYDAYRKRLETAGRWAIIFSDATEFVFGDGFLHNFSADANAMGAGKKCILPLTPTAAIAHMLPISHPSDPKLVTMRLTPAEVLQLNHFVQVYSKDYVFFRGQKPELTDEFTCGEHKEFRYHRHPWLDDLLDDLAQYNLWGPGGTPSRCQREPRGFDLDEWADRVGSRGQD